MAGFYDVYALAPARTADAVERFLARFVPAREPSAADYLVPHLADTPAVTFGTAVQVVRCCVARPGEPYTLYWRSLASGDPAHAMAFFTADGGLILGLSVAADAGRWLGELVAETGGSAGWVGFEEPPPDTGAEFLAVASRHTELVAVVGRGRLCDPGR